MGWNWFSIPLLKFLLYVGKTWQDASAALVLPAGPAAGLYPSLQGMCVLCAANPTLALASFSAALRSRMSLSRVATYMVTYTATACSMQHDNSMQYSTRFTLLRAAESQAWSIV